MEPSKEKTKMGRPKTDIEKKVVGVYMSTDQKRIIRSLAKKGDRSLSAQASRMLTEWIKDHADQIEVEPIINSHN